MNQEYTARGIAKYAGAFIVWMIGSGFASGQETLQFFTSYGLASYTAIGFNFIGTLFFGVVFVETGYRNRELSPLQPFSLLLRESGRPVLFRSDRRYCVFADGGFNLGCGSHPAGILWSEPPRRVVVDGGSSFGCVPLWV